MPVDTWEHYLNLSDHLLKQVRNFTARDGHSLMSSKAITFLTNKRAYLRPEPLNLLSAKGCKVKYVTSPGFRGNKWSHYLRYNKKWPFVHFSQYFCVLKWFVVSDHTHFWQPRGVIRLLFNLNIVWPSTARNSSCLHLQKFFIIIYGH